MGSEQSSQSQQTSLRRQGSVTSQSSVNSQQQPGNLRRQHTIANPGVLRCEERESRIVDSRPGSISPGPSICSDSELPYISYTVNRPIGTDSPKLQNKLANKGKLSNLRKAAPKKSSKMVKLSTHNIVVVKSASMAPPVEEDAEIMRLKSIPMFQPIMRGTLNLPTQRDPDILKRLDVGPFVNICARYQLHLAKCSNLVACEQTVLTHKIKEIDGDLNRVMATAAERQKKYVKTVEKVQKVADLSAYLNRCHTMLNELLESMDTLNNMLDVDDRLEPFVWTTG